ncbi:uncharacterized protein LOC110840944 isoform X2 [Zootermopsis nevadensis]|uniref:Apolipoprotein D n=1 Tax=Zootermopsis nevadensis TaxID=136037 RepID=A0A067QPI8_ZOONE|nr:uncharacterized protein LOC110840944 isoform X1 [Zootermopsis nevadensis]XP_021941953.1 uncharacterized protein LOC110840944 isoform X2 [Zootermopsis nevadensis]KDQ71699.1 hypothetical protein L798_05243 [Zootermopsis nevadensis]
MIKLPYAIVVILLTYFIVADAECNVEPVKDINLDMDKYLGTWCWVFHTPSDVDKNAGCIKEIAQKFNESTIVVPTAFYDERTKQIKIFQGSIYSWNSTSFTETLNGWSATYFVLAVDYSSYIVTSACLRNELAPLTWIGFRTCVPDDHTIKEAMDALDALDTSSGASNRLVKFNDCDYIQNAMFP